MVYNEPMKTLRVLATTFLLVALAGPAAAAASDYSVGPGQALASIGEVPWAALGPGDRVLIHWRPTPYREKWVINRRGTAAAPIVIRGVPGPQGQLPVIDGRDAVTAPGLNFWNEERGLIKIGGSNTPPDGLPAHIVIEQLELRSARPPFTFEDDGGSQSTYVDNAASIYIEKGEHLVIRGCIIHDSGNGVFSGDFDGQTRDLVLDGNSIHGNGNIGSAFHHNTYLSGIGVVYQNNRFGPLRAGADGNSLKDRSAGLVVRYNWLEGGNRQLDLVDSNSATVIAEPSYRSTFVYGNVLIEPDGDGNSQIEHYGGDGGDPGNYRQGTLHFYNNTVVSTRAGNTTLLRLSTEAESADVRNNILYVTAAGDRLAMLAAAGTLDLSHNWTKPGWRDSHSGLTGIINDDGTNITGTDPGFADEPMQDYALLSGADTVDACTTLLPEALPANDLLRQYFKHQASVPRPSDGAFDAGAFEYCPEMTCGLLFEDGFESGELSAW